MKTYKPITKGLRWKTTDDFADLTRSRPEKSLLRPIHRTGGRSSSGRLTNRRTGGGHKKRYRLIDFTRKKLDVPATVAAIEYDPNRSARIALLHYLDGEKSYIVAPHGLKPGQKILSSDGEIDINPGNALILKNIPPGTAIYNVELKPGAGGQLARSAGTMAQLMGKEEDVALIKLPSGETRKLNIRCRATIGQVGNLDHENLILGKAGRSRWLGRRPHTRGTAMNPVDHPHGGGHGKDHGGRNPVTPWGKPTRGYKTRNNKMTDRFIVSRRPT